MDHARIAVVTTTLDWSHRWTTSGERFDLARARAYVKRHVALQLRFMEEAAALGADLVLAPEYFEGTELFLTTPENRRQFVDRAEQSATIAKLQELSARRGVYLACAFGLFHGDALAQTGVITGRRGELVGLQIKHTSLPRETHTDHPYALFDLDIGRAAVFTCSDLTTYPEDPIALARQAMQILITPGCGFGPPEYLQTRAADLGCVLVHADGGRGLILDGRGRTLARTTTPDAIAFADVPIPPREPVTRLRWGYN